MGNDLCPPDRHSGRAYEIIKRLEKKGSSKILLRLKEGLTNRDVKKGQKHKVFEDSFDAKPIYHRDLLLQKINYIHLNCVRGKCPPDRTGREIGRSLGRS